MLEHFNQNNAEQGHRISPMMIVLIHLFQFSYTSIFGVYSSFLFIRTGHFIPSFLVHTLCNSLGIPDIMNLIDMNDGRRLHKFIYMVFYVIGLLLFSISLYPLTQSKFYYSNDSSSHIYRYWSI